VSSQDALIYKIKLSGYTEDKSKGPFAENIFNLVQSDRLFKDAEKSYSDSSRKTHFNFGLGVAAATYRAFSSFNDRTHASKGKSQKLLALNIYDLSSWLWGALS
jgi:hypothetical protein